MAGTFAGFTQYTSLGVSLRGLLFPYRLYRSVEDCSADYRSNGWKRVKWDATATGSRLANMGGSFAAAECHF